MIAGLSDLLRATLTDSESQADAWGSTTEARD
jgi:hypothetical protein